MNEQEREALPLQECEREPFEAYMLETGYGIGALEKHGNGHYWDDEVSAAWWAWNRRAALAANEKQPNRATDIATALALPGCERLREWAEIGPVQMAAVEEFAYALAAKVPAGYKLVPVEPTPAMVKAAIDSLRDAHCIVPQPWKMQDALEAALAAQGVPADMLTALKDAVEGECHGLSITDDQAKAILEYTLAATPAPAPEAEPKAQQAAAVATLERLGYEWQGGELWKPPLGHAPPWAKPEAQQEVQDVPADDREAFEAYCTRKHDFKKVWSREVAGEVYERSPDGGYANFTMHACWMAWQKGQARAALAANVPAGFVLVPLRPNQAMRDVMDSEGWEWAELLAAAEAVDEPTYEALKAAQAQQAAEPLPCPFCGHVGLDFADGSTHRWGLASCAGCGATCGETRRAYPHDDKWHANAIKDWNTRAKPEAQQPIGQLFQHYETGRTRVVLRGDVADCDARWFKVGDLVLAGIGASGEAIK